MKLLRQSTVLLMLLVTLPAFGAALPVGQYRSELNEIVAHIKRNDLAQASTLLEKRGERDLLYFLERGELFALGGNAAASLQAWIKGDEFIQTRESKFRTHPEALFADFDRVPGNDGSDNYDAQDYEKLLLSTRLIMNHLQLGNFNETRNEIEKTGVREKLIRDFHTQHAITLQTEADRQEIGTIGPPDGYPIQELNTREVSALKNGFQNAFAHYLAAYFFEITNEPALAESAYLTAQQLAPGKSIIQNSLDTIGTSATIRTGETSRASGTIAPLPAKEGESDVLFVIETGFAPSIHALNVPMSVQRKNVTATSLISLPVLKSSERVQVPSALLVAAQYCPVETLTNIDTLARRQLKDQLSERILRSILRSGYTLNVESSSDEAQQIDDLLANRAEESLATLEPGEPADERNWRTLPERISIARANVPHGRQHIEFQTRSGLYQTDVEISGRYTIVPIRITGEAIYVGKPNLSENVAQVSEETLLPNNSPPAGLPANFEAESANLGQRVLIGDTTYIGDFRFAQPGGLPSGKGIVEWRSGERFEGQLINGEKQGYGTFISPGKFRYEGEWDADKQNGKGKTTFESGDTYEGDMKEGEFDGQGTYTSTNGNRYEGAWQNGLKDGAGKLSYPNGDFWEGIFSNDQRTDLGEMNFISKPGIEYHVRPTTLPSLEAAPAEVP